MTEQEELELLKQNSPYALPDDPSASGWSTDQIKKKFYSGLVILYNFFKQSRNTQNSMIQAMQELVNEINASYSAITSQETILKVKYDMEGNEIVSTYAKLLDIANGTVAACKYISEDGTSKKFIYDLEKALATLTTNFNLVKEWADNIKSATSQEAVQRAVSATKDSLGNIIKDTYATVGSFSTVANNIANIIDGTTIVGKAYKDQNGNLIDTYYAKETDMTEVKGKIPNNASSNNQLADKEFVNSSIATATATYRGSYNLVSDLSLTTSASQSDIATALGTTIATADNNDYCYVRIPVANDNTTTISRVDRYKNNGNVWTFEYTLNNSGYTSEQWSAINSGITSALVAAIGLNTDARHTHSNKALLDTYTQTETDLADAVSKKHSHENKAVLDNLTQAHLDNSHTHSNKTVLDGITEEDINNIPKSLYNLGSFDTISGNTITRQTRYVVIKGDTFNWDSDNPYSNFYGIFYSNALADIVAPADGYEIPKMSARGWNVYAREDVINHNQGITIQPSGNYLMIRDTSCSTKAELIAKLNANPIYIEYQSTTYNYTEDIIPNAPLLNLDQDGCNFLRNEWEKGLNLFDKNKVFVGDINSVNGVLTGSTSFRASDYIEIEPNTTYSNNLKVKSFTSTGLAFYDSNKTYISGIKNNSSAYNTFTTPSNAKYVRFSMDISYEQPYDDLNAIMLVEGTHPYPYQEYNGAIVHKADIEPVLLWENSSPTSSFANQTITTKDMSAYKYIVVEYKYAKESSNTSQFAKLKYLYQGDGFALNGMYIPGGEFASRLLYFSDTTHIVFSDTSLMNGSFTITTNNDYIIPVAIYGTNLL